MIEFFMPMEPPTATHQEKSVRVVGGKPVFYEPTELKAARMKLRGHLVRHAPQDPMRGPVQLLVNGASLFAAGIATASTAPRAPIPITCKSF